MDDPFKHINDMTRRTNAMEELQRQFDRVSEIERMAAGLARFQALGRAAAGSSRELAMIEDTINPPHIRRMMEQIANPPHIQRMIDDLINPPYLDRMMNERARAEGFYARLTNVGKGASPVAEAIERMTANHAALEAGARIQAMIPALPERIALAERISGLVEPHRQMVDRFAWKNDLVDRMAGIGQRWAIAERLDVSGLAFGRLARFADGIRFDEPYTTDTRAFIAEELGEVIDGEIVGDVEEREARFDAAGRDPALIAFPTESYSGVLIAARFELILPAVRVPEPVEGGEGVGEFIYDGNHNELLGQIEQHLRQFVDARMAAVVGPDWIAARVHPDMIAEWTRRQDDDRRRSRPVFSPIQYADFMDLSKIMGGKANWREVFGPVFRERMWMEASLCRLHPIRLSLAHARPISQSDVLCLLSEGMQLMRAIGVATAIQ